jgi:hypothetical protein
VCCHCCINYRAGSNLLIVDISAFVTGTLVCTGNYNVPLILLRVVVLKYYQQ